MRYLGAGATGNIGSLVTNRLLDAGERPCVLTRDAREARKVFGNRVDVRVGNLAGPRALIRRPWQVR
jgi:uncharacterized protein YbjT (DUF2867 family)